MTLLEDLEEVAREIDCPVSDLCTAEDNCTRRRLAARLRAHAERLRDELMANGQYRFRSTHALEAFMALEHVNGGPVQP